MLKPGGVAFLRSQFADLMPDLFWYDYFPSAREVDAGMYLTARPVQGARARQPGCGPDEEPGLGEHGKPRTLRESYERLKLAGAVDVRAPARGRDRARVRALGGRCRARPGPLMPVYPAAMLVHASQRTLSADGLRKTRPRGGGEPGASRRPGSAVRRRPRSASPAGSGACRGRCAVRWRRPGGGGRWSGVRRTSSGDAKTVGIAAGAGQRHRDEVAAADRRSGQLDVAGGVAVDHGGGRLQAERLLDRVGQQRSVGEHQRRAGPG